MRNLMILLLIVTITGAGTALCDEPWDAYLQNPLVMWPIIIDNASSLPWANPGAWDGIDANYSTTSLAEDTVTFLADQPSALVRMETLRRALVYGRKEPAASYRLLAALKTRMETAERTGTIDPLACFDYGYFVEAFKQARWLDRTLVDDVNTFDYVVNSGIRIFGDDLEMLYGAGLMCLEPPGVYPYVRYHKTAVREAEDGSLVARNFVSHFKSRGATFKEIQESIYYAR